MDPTLLAASGLRVDAGSVNDERDAAAGPPNFGLPEHSALTIEGRIERAAGVGSRAARVRDGRERPLRQSSWTGGLWLIAGAFALLVVVLAILYMLG